MKNKGLLLSGLTALALVGYVIFDFQKEKWDKEKKDQQMKILNFSDDQVNQIEIIHSDPSRAQDNVLLKKTIDGWNLEKPANDWADNDAVDSFVKGLCTEKATDVVENSNGQTDWKAYGLDDQNATSTTILIQTNDGRKVSLKISNHKNFQGDSYIRRDSENKVVIGNGTWQARAAKTSLELRDRRLFRKPSAKILGFKINDIEVGLKDSEWIMLNSPNYKLDQNKVRELITAVTEIKATEFVSEKELTTQEKSKWGFVKPISQIEIKLKDNKSQVLTIAAEGKDKDRNYRATNSDLKPTLRLDGSQLNKILSVTRDSLRDREEPFKFAKANVSAIEIKSAMKINNLKKAGADWSLDSKKVETKAVEDFLTALRGLKVKDFSNQKTTLANQIKLFDQQGKLIWSFAWAKNSASVEGFSEAFTVDQADLDKLQIEKLLTSVNAETKK